jgi:hypothetical protein
VAGSADWYGWASVSYENTSWMLESDMRKAAEGCHGAAAACQAFANDLRQAQHDAKTSAKAYADAREEQRQAEAAARVAAQQAAAKRQEATSAGTAATHARAGGPQNEPAAAQHDQAAHAAADAATDLEGAARRAGDRATAADQAALKALQENQRANEDADRAAEKATTAMHHAGAAFGEPITGIAPAVPVSIRGGGNPLLPGLPALGGLGRTPSDVRRQQIDLERRIDDQRRADAIKRAEAEAKRRHGNMIDAAGGLIDAVNIVGGSPIGRKDTSAYQNEKKLSEIALLAAGATGIAKKLGPKAVEKILKKEGDELGESGARRLTRTEVRKRDTADRVWKNSEEGRAWAKKVAKHQKMATYLDQASDVVDKFVLPPTLAHLPHALKILAALLRDASLSDYLRAKAYADAQRILELLRRFGR